jgi:hypothetical protein
MTCAVVWAAASRQAKENLFYKASKSKNGNVVVNAVLLALSDALRDPNYVAHLLREV